MNEQYQKTGFKLWTICVLFLVLGLATRFYRIDWSVSGDHTSFVQGVRSLLEKPFFLAEFEAEDVQSRGAPVGSVLQALTFKVFGTSEAGSRSGSAIAGAIAIAACVLLVSNLYGLPHGMIVGAMLLLWPWLLESSQSNRHYAFAFLFASIAILATCMAWRRNSFAWGAAGGVFSAVAISTHTITAVVPAGLLLFLVVEILTKRSPIQKRALAGFVLVGGPLMLASVALVAWALGAYVSSAAEAGWGRSPNIHALVYNLGWSIALLSFLGGLLAWGASDPADRMWLMIAVVIVASCVFVPFVTAFRPDYVFPSALALFLLASRVLTRVYEAASTNSRVLAVGVVTAFVLFPLPSFVSYYQDGNRKDYRSAAAFIKDHFQPGDLVAADQSGAFAYYYQGPIHPAPRPSTAPAQTVQTLTELASQGNRVWYVCRFAREEPATNVDRWFWQNAIRMLRIKRKRFDYHENILDVYLFNPSAKDRELIENEVPRASTTTPPHSSDDD